MTLALPQIDALASQRVNGRGRLAVARVDGRTRLRTLYQEGAAKIRLPATGADPLEAILINTAGGLTGGDRLDWQVEAAAGSAVVLTTPASEKLYRTPGGGAEVAIRLRAAAGASLAWLPQETIAYDGSSVSRRLDVDLDADAGLLMVEATVFGRSAMGETVARASFRDRWRVRVGGRLVHAEDVRLGPAMASTLDRAAALGGARAMATVLMVGPQAERHLDAARVIVGETGGGVSHWAVAGTGKLLARLVAGDGYGLRQRLVPLLVLLNGRAGLPKSWSL
jgi:urease accessory protein